MPLKHVWQRKMDFLGGDYDYICLNCGEKRNINEGRIVFETKCLPKDDLVKLSWKDDRSRAQAAAILKSMKEK